MRHAKLALAAALAWALLCPPVMAAAAQVVGSTFGGTIFPLTFTAGGSNAMAINTAVPANSLISVIFEGAVAGSQDVSCSDPISGTYSAPVAVANQTGASAKILYFYTVPGLASGTVITCTITSGSNAFATGVAAWSGMPTSPYDTGVGAGVANATGVVTTGPTPALACPGGGTNCELVIGGQVRHAAATGVLDPTYTALGTPTTQFIWGWKWVSSTAAVSMTNTWTSTQNLAGQVLAFKAAATIPSANKLLFRPIP